ncbi:nucleolar protein 8 [Rhizophlyctis rosea]|nr:nucleolar protein 8 [Rhizophlyctis rosea]
MATTEGTVTDPVTTTVVDTKPASTAPLEKITKRLYVGGLNASVSTADLEGRFKAFGTVTDVKIPEPGPLGCRGFGYITMHTDTAKLHKCLSLYSGAQWKGMKLKIEEAKADYLTKLKREWAARVQQAAAAESQPTISKKKRKRKLIDVAEDMSLVTDENVETRKGWKRSRFGRAVAVLNTRDKTTNKIVKLDLSKYKDNIKRLAPGTRDTSIEDLSWPVADDESEDEAAEETLEQTVSNAFAVDAEAMDEDCPWSRVFMKASGVEVESEDEDVDLEDVADMEVEDKAGAAQEEVEEAEVHSNAEASSDAEGLEKDSDTAEVSDGSSVSEDEGDILGDILRSSSPALADDSESSDSTPSTPPAKSSDNKEPTPTPHRTRKANKGAPKTTPIQLPPGLSDSDSEPEPTTRKTDRSKPVVTEPADPSMAKERQGLLKLAATIFTEERAAKNKGRENVTRFDESDESDAEKGVVLFESEEEEEEEEGGDDGASETSVMARFFLTNVTLSLVAGIWDNARVYMKEYTTLIGGFALNGSAQTRKREHKEDDDEGYASFDEEDEYNGTSFMPNGLDMKGGAKKGNDSSSSESSESSESDEKDSDSSEDDREGSRKEESEDSESSSDDSSSGEEGGKDDKEGGKEDDGDSDDTSDDSDEDEEEEEEKKEAGEKEIEEEESEDESEESSESESVEESDSDEESDEEGKAESKPEKSKMQTDAPVTGGPTPASEPPVVVANTNLRALVFGGAEGGGSFSLFGGPSEPKPAASGGEEIATFKMKFAQSAPAPSFRLFEDKMEVDDEGAGQSVQEHQRFDEAQVAKSLGTSKMFFLHMGNSDLAHRSNYEPDGTFMRHKSMEEIQAEWEEARGELTLDYKRKHKSAFRRREKMKRKRGKFTAE